MNGSTTPVPPVATTVTTTATTSFVPPSVDAYAPREIAARLAEFSVVKVRLPLLSLWLLGLLAGAYISIGALLFTLVASDASLGFAASRLLGGFVFSLGLVLVSVADAELFTGNNLLVMAWADGRIDSRAVLRNWAVVGLANLVGSVGLAVLVWGAGHAQMNGRAVGQTAIKIAVAKAALPPLDAFCRGLLCNVLVCMAVWMALAMWWAAASSSPGCTG
jgi:formate/nitrite transporter FocA (FNT family)